MERFQLVTYNVIVVTKLYILKWNDSIANKNMLKAKRKFKMTRKCGGLG